MKRELKDLPDLKPDGPVRLIAKRIPMKRELKAETRSWQFSPQKARIAKRIPMKRELKVGAARRILRAM